MRNDLDYKEAYLTMMRASEQAIRGLEILQQGTAKIMLSLIQAQQKQRSCCWNDEAPAPSDED